eukprot:gene9162-1250_t
MKRKYETRGYLLEKIKKEKDSLNIVQRIPYSIRLYILEFHYFSFNGETSQDMMADVYGYFSTDQRRKIYLIFNGMEIMGSLNFRLPSGIRTIITSSLATMAHLLYLFQKNHIDKKYAQVYTKSLKGLIITSTDYFGIPDVFQMLSNIEAIGIRDNRQNNEKKIEENLIKIVRKNQLKDFSLNSKFAFESSELAKELSKCPLVDLHINNSTITDSFVKELNLGTMKSLRNIHFHGMNLSEEGLNELSNVKNLKSYFVPDLGRSFSKKQQLRIVENSPNLESLGIEEMDISCLIKLKNLSHLYLLETRSGIRGIINCSNLKSLSFYSYIKPNELKECLKLPNLKDFTILSFEEDDCCYNELDFENLQNSIEKFEMRNVIIKPISKKFLQFVVNSYLKYLNIGSAAIPQNLNKILMKKKKIDLEVVNFY